MLRILRLRDALAECVVSNAFYDMKQFANIGEILLSEAFGDLMWYVCKAMYSMYCLLRLTDMRIDKID